MNEQLSTPEAAAQWVRDQLDGDQDGIETCGHLAQGIIEMAGEIQRLRKLEDSFYTYRKTVCEWLHGHQQTNHRDQAE